MEDREIIALFQERSQQAILSLQEKYGNVCLRVAENILKDSHDAEECVNDAWLAVWNTVPPQNPEPLISYVCRITRNLALKKYRYNTAQKRNSFYDVSLSELEDCIPATVQGPEACAEEELTVIIEEFLDSLDQESRVLFVKRYWYSEPVKSIARELGMTQNHAAVKLRRIRGRLKSYLEERGVML